MSSSQFEPKTVSWDVIKTWIPQTISLLLRQPLMFALTTALYIFLVWLAAEWFTDMGVIAAYFLWWPFTLWQVMLAECADKSLPLSRYFFRLAPFQATHIIRVWRIYAMFPLAVILLGFFVVYVLAPAHPRHVIPNTYWQSSERVMMSTYTHSVIAFAITMLVPLTVCVKIPVRQVFSQSFRNLKVNGLAGLFMWILAFPMLFTDTLSTTIIIYFPLLSAMTYVAFRSIWLDIHKNEPRLKTAAIMRPAPIR